MHVHEASTREYTLRLLSPLCYYFYPLPLTPCSIFGEWMKFVMALNCYCVQIGRQRKLQRHFNFVLQMNWYQLTKAPGSIASSSWLLLKRFETYLIRERYQPHPDHLNSHQHPPYNHHHHHHHHHHHYHNHNQYYQHRSHPLSSSGLSFFLSFHSFSFFLSIPHRRPHPLSHLAFHPRRLIYSHLLRHPDPLAFDTVSCSSTIVTTTEVI